MDDSSDRSARDRSGKAGPEEEPLLLRSRPEDFRVEEMPLYDPDGGDGHLLVLIEKTGRTTDEISREFARVLGLDERSIGFAGRKDRWAVTQQWFSLPMRGERLEHVHALEIEGLRVLRVETHSQKLRLGDLRGNRFRIQLRGQHAADFAGAERVEAICRQGMVNRFGPQRFGRRGGNVQQGLEVLRGRGRRRDPRLARLLVSALQSEVFHQMLGARAEELATTEDLAAVALLEGDILLEHRTGFLQRLEIDGARQNSTAARDVERCLASPTAMLFGPSAWRARSLSGRLEERVLESAGIDLTDRATLRALQRLRLRGTRRALRVPVEELEWNGEPVDPVWCFVLPAGSYATVLLEQIYGRGRVQNAEHEG